MARKAGEKHREETEEAKQSQVGTPGPQDSLFKMLTLVLSPHKPATVPPAAPGLYLPSEAQTIISKGPGLLHSSVKTQSLGQM